MKGFYAGISQVSDDLDIFTFILTAVCSLVTIGIVITTVYLCYKFHASRKSDKAENFQSTKLEFLWTSITFVIFMGFFAYAAYLYKKQITPPEKSDYEVFVYAKRWMWKFYHKNGFAEVNRLHVPRGKNVRLTMISKDIIHSFFLPDLRIKQDVLPEAYTFLNVNSLKNGDYRIYCAEYCGSYHAQMTGITTVMEEKDYLQHVGMIQKEEANRGEELFEQNGCIGCHFKNSEIAPDLSIISAKRDDNFLRRSILYPKEFVEPGFEPVMPSFKDTLSEEDIRALIDYIRSTEVR